MHVIRNKIYIFYYLIYGHLIHFTKLCQAQGLHILAYYHGITYMLSQSLRQGMLHRKFKEKCGNKMKENMERNEEKPSLTNNFIIIIHIFYQQKARLYILMYPVPWIKHINDRLIRLKKKCKICLCGHIDLYQAFRV